MHYRQGFTVGHGIWAHTTWATKASERVSSPGRGYTEAAGGDVLVALARKDTEAKGFAGDNLRKY